MKKVLMIAFNYPPLAGMGMLRSLKFAKYLPSFGWQPAILTIATSKIKPTPQSQYWFCDESEGLLPQVDIIRTNYLSLKQSTIYQLYLNLFRRDPDWRASEAITEIPEAFRTSPNIRDKVMGHLRLFWNNWIEFPDDAIGWYPYAVKGAMRYIRQNPVEAIFSTSLPITSHLIARSLSRRSGIPWVADFRDPWSHGHYRKISKIKQKIDTCLEGSIMNNANALITVSEPLKEELLQLHKTSGDKSFVIYNGFDADDYQEAEMPSDRPFTITFTGRMYDIDFSTKGRTPALLFEGMAVLIRQNRIPSGRLKCMIYGEYPKELMEMIAYYGLQQNVTCLGGVPFRDSLHAQQQADVLLHLNWDDRDHKGILTGKIFEYLGAKRNILSIPFHNQGIEDILKTTRAGVILNDAVACKEQLLRWYQEFHDQGFIKYHGVPEKLELYSRKKETEKLADILNQVSGHGT